VTTVGVTGSRGFIGENLCAALLRAGVHELRRISREGASLEEQLRGVDVVIHLAGVNRVAEEQEFVQGNVEFTRRLCAALDAAGSPAHVLFASTIHAESDSPYGRSKREAEKILREFAERERPGARPSTVIYRMPNVFGKWGQPYYNSAVITFAWAIARGQPYEVHDPKTLLRLVYVDDVVAELLRQCEAPRERGRALPGEVSPVHEATLGQIEAMLRTFADSRRTQYLPSFDDAFTRKLFATYTASLPHENLTYPLLERTDARGTLAEVVKSSQGGQIFVSVTRPGAVRGRHFHDTKVEKFLVLRGQAAIDMRDVRTDEQWRIETSGERWEVIDIPPGVAHKITAVGSDELVMLFWANEPFDPARPDTYSAPVANE
jgi:UDP-2-acetamido-2,6-beta-L-arabino-hexul-4-ose reductase